MDLYPQLLLLINVGLIIGVRVRRGGRGSGGEVEPVRPARVGRAVAEHPPGRPLRRGGDACSRQPSSAGVLSPLVWLHRAQAATTFSQACRPPRLRGKHVVDGLGRAAAVGAAPAVAGEDRPAGEADVGAVRHPDVAGEPDHRRDRQAWRALCRMPSPSATQTALADRTRMVARRTDTTHSGSYVALRTNADEPTVGRMSGIAAHPLGRAATLVSRSGPRPDAPDHRRPCANSP